jgi:hypothetical protein
VKWSLTFEASTSVAICDESPLLQSIGPTVIKKKRYWSLINKNEWKLNYPLFPAHKRSAPTRPPRRTRQWTKPSPDEKKKKTKKNSQRQYWPMKFIICHWPESKYVYLQQQSQVASIFSIHFVKSIFPNKLPDNRAGSNCLYK